MKKLITAAFGLLFAVCVSYTAVAGSLDSPGAPSAGSGMYTLQNLYDYLTSGTALTVQASFQEPTSAPGATMKTTKEIGDAIKDKFNLCVATADNVEQGVTFFCTQSGSWGVQTGTLAALPRPTATPTLTPTPTLIPTQTPTPTPTLSAWHAECVNQHGGVWGALNDGSGQSGCWFTWSGENSPAAVCSAMGLSCSNTGWNDDTSCTINMAVLGPCATCSSWGAAGIIGRYDAVPNSSCMYLPEPNVNDCDRVYTESRWTGLVVCTK
ncbi:MAG: hypothetical protein NTZ78_07005 [Candidatus Aureabacteria bacterium]|nr:hypothetical protein [Candidatus Auribacterota bacterium]